MKNGGNAALAYREQLPHGKFAISSGISLYEPAGAGMMVGLGILAWGCARMASVGVVVPARDEEERIGPCLASLAPFFAAGGPVIVVDAQSRDNTRRLAAEWGAEVLEAPCWRRGRAAALGIRFLERMEPRPSVVLIAHADMVFPPNAREAILAALEREPDAPGGYLGHRIAEPGWAFRLIEWGNRFRAKRFSMPYGDQAQFFRPGALARAGGFPDIGAFEDVELSLRLVSLGRLVDAGAPVTIDGRHWRRGIVRVTLRNWIATAKYLRTRRRTVYDASLRGD